MIGALWKKGQKETHFYLFFFSRRDSCERVHPGSKPYLFLLWALPSSGFEITGTWVLSTIFTGCRDPSLQLKVFSSLVVKTMCLSRTFTVSIFELLPAMTFQFLRCHYSLVVFLLLIKSWHVRRLSSISSLFLQLPKARLSSSLLGNNADFLVLPLYDSVVIKSRSSLDAFPYKPYSVKGRSLVLIKFFWFVPT